MRSIAGALAVALTVGVAVTAGPAIGAPRQVGTVTMKAATRTSLTIDWHGVTGADRYVVERGRGLSMSNRTVVATVGRSRATLTGLQPGGLYCFQVRAKNASGLGDRSGKACEYTIDQQGAASGAVYDVFTFNTCGLHCGGWNERSARAGSLIRFRHPDVVMLQETPRKPNMGKVIGGFRRISEHKGKALLYRKSRFDVARNAAGHPRRGWIDLGYDPNGGKHKFAVWAELIDEAHRGKRVIFVSLHLASGRSQSAINARRTNVNRLLAGIRSVNNRNVPVVFAGDWNSNQGRENQDVPGQLMTQAGYKNAYFNAQRWERWNHNSANQGSSTPKIGPSWGYHVDQVWSNPRRSRVLKWQNAARLINGHYPMPAISDHTPVMVKISVS